MYARTTTRTFRMLGLLAATLLTVAGCKKADTNPYAACRAQGGTGISSRTIMFWTATDLKCGPVSLTSIRATEVGGSASGGVLGTTISLYYPAQPACGANGTITVQALRGYDYEYTLACTGRQWKGTVAVDCGTDCIAVELK